MYAINTLGIHWLNNIVDMKTTAVYLATEGKEFSFNGCMKRPIRLDIKNGALLKKQWSLIMNMLVFSSRRFLLP